MAKLATALSAALLLLLPSITDSGFVDNICKSMKTRAQLVCALPGHPLKFCDDYCKGVIPFVIPKAVVKISPTTNEPTGGTC